MIERAFAVRLAIPDNEAYTAMVTLQRLGIRCESVERAEIHIFGLEDDAPADELDRVVPTIATIYNPNKHRLRRLSAPRPMKGEVWVTARELPEVHDQVVVGGIRLPGVRSAWKATSWRLQDAAGNDVSTELLDRAVETLLCNSAFQRAITA